MKRIIALLLLPLFALAQLAEFTETGPGSVGTMRTKLNAGFRQTNTNTADIAAWGGVGSPDLPGRITALEAETNVWNNAIFPTSTGPVNIESSDDSFHIGSSVATYFSVGGTTPFALYSGSAIVFGPLTVTGNPTEPTHVGNVAWNDGLYAALGSGGDPGNYIAVSNAALSAVQDNNTGIGTLISAQGQIELNSAAGVLLYTAGNIELNPVSGNIEIVNGALGGNMDDPPGGGYVGDQDYNDGRYLYNAGTSNFTLIDAAIAGAVSDPGNYTTVSNNAMGAVQNTGTGGDMVINNVSGDLTINSSAPLYITSPVVEMDHAILAYVADPSGGGATNQVADMGFNDARYLTMGGASGTNAVIAEAVSQATGAGAPNAALFDSISSIITNASGITTGGNLYFGAVSTFIGGNIIQSGGAKITVAGGGIDMDTSPLTNASSIHSAGLIMVDTDPTADGHVGNRGYSDTRYLYNVGTSNYTLIAEAIAESGGDPNVALLNGLDLLTNTLGIVNSEDIDVQSTGGSVNIDGLLNVYIAAGANDTLAITSSGIQVDGDITTTDNITLDEEIMFAGGMKIVASNNTFYFWTNP